MCLAGEVVPFILELNLHVTQELEKLIAGSLGTGVAAGLAAAP